MTISPSWKTEQREVTLNKKKIHRGSTVYWVTLSNYYLKEGNVGLNVHVNTAVFWKPLDMFLHTEIPINFQTTSMTPVQENILIIKKIIIILKFHTSMFFFSLTFSMTNISVINLAYTYDMSQQWHRWVNKNIQYTSLTSAEAKRMIKHNIMENNIYSDHGIKVQEKIYFVQH